MQLKCGLSYHSIYVIGKALFLLIQLLRHSEYVIHFLFFKAEEAEDIDDQSGPSNSRKRVARTENSYREVPTKRLKPTPSQVMMERFNKVSPHLDSFPYCLLNLIKENLESLHCQVGKVALIMSYNPDVLNHAKFCSHAIGKR